MDFNKIDTRKKYNQLKLLSLEMFIVIITFLVALLGMLFVIRKVFFSNTDVFDQRAFNYLAGFVSERNTTIMNVFTFFGSQNFLIPAFLFLIIYYFFFKKERWLGIRISSVATSSLIVMFVLKWIFNRPRPLTPLLHPVPGYSFPSGHAFMSFAFCSIIIYIIYKESKVGYLKFVLLLLMLIFTFFIGLSRIYLRVHYASDVIAGFCMGFIWVVISLLIVHFLEKKHKSKLPDVEVVV